MAASERRPQELNALVGITEILTGSLSFFSWLTNRVLEKPILIGDLEEAIGSVTGLGRN